MPLQCTNCNASFDDLHRYCPRCGRVLTKPEKSNFPLLIIAGVLVFFAVFGILSWQFTGSFKKIISSKFLAKKNYEVSIKPPTTRVWGTSKPTFSLQDMKTLRDLFEKRQFDALTKTASDIQAAFERDPVYEYQSNDFFYFFGSALPEYQELLDAWVAHSPTHFAPHLARAHYYYDRAWANRGSKYASETTSEQFRQMHLDFQKAAQDIGAALAINPRLLTAYIMRMRMYNADGEAAKEDTAINEARSIFPTSFLIYSAMLKSKLPRWGGSYAEMDKLAQEAFKKVDRNPEMYMLFGQIYADQAWYSRKEKQYDTALALYSKAISYGEHRSFFEERARTYSYMKDYDRALKDIDYSISLRPTVAASYCLRSTINIYRGNTDGAIQDVRLLKLYFPGDHQTHEWYGWAAKQFLNQGHTVFKTSWERAIAAYDAALEINPQYAEAYYWRGVAYSRLKRMDLAYSDMISAVKYDPRNFESYRMLDYILASQQKWSEIIDHWNQFLSLEPQNADAYFERAGTYRHKGDMKNAIADLRKACSLGKQEACKILKQYE
jgi:tetratricopeptide (TPR) repeat protein